MLTYNLIGDPQVPKVAFKQLILNRVRDLDVKFDDRLAVPDIYYIRARRWKIRPDVLLAQCFLETNYLRSVWSLPPYHNMAGIGVTGVPGAGLMFEDYIDGVDCHFAHMSAYCIQYEVNHASEIDPRWNLVKQLMNSKRLPLVRTLDDLNGRWSSSLNYSAPIKSILQAAYSLR